jgi:Ca-activated chloride channel family protein
VEPGSNQNAAIILLTDGRRTTGPHPVDAARMAAERGIKVFTVGFGSAQGGMASMDGYSMFMAFDEESLRAIADITKAEYFHAATGAELIKIYEGLSSKLVMSREQTEISFLFGAASALLLLAAGALSLLWFNRAF